MCSSLVWGRSTLCVGGTGCVCTPRSRLIGVRDPGTFAGMWSPANRRASCAVFPACAESSSPHAHGGEQAPLDTLMWRVCVSECWPASTRKPWAGSDDTAQGMERWKHSALCTEMITRELNPAAVNLDCDPESQATSAGHGSRGLRSPRGATPWGWQGVFSRAVCPAPPSQPR